MCVKLTLAELIQRFKFTKAPNTQASTHIHVHIHVLPSPSACTCTSRPLFVASEPSMEYDYV